ncbi:MAG: hypothetical protein V4726_02165 [Verrucomicrobiota bacterium]
MEFIPAIARDLLQTPPAATDSGTAPLSPLLELLDFGLGKETETKEKMPPASRQDRPPSPFSLLFDLIPSAESLGAEPPAKAGPVFSLQSLAGPPPDAASKPLISKIGKPVPAPAPEISPAPSPSVPFSLADLAGQLSSRLVDQRSEAASDLLMPEIVHPAVGQPPVAEDLKAAWGSLIPDITEKPAVAVSAASPVGDEAGSWSTPAFNQISSGESVVPKKSPKPSAHPPAALLAPPLPAKPPAYSSRRNRAPVETAPPAPASETTELKVNQIEETEIHTGSVSRNARTPEENEVHPLFAGTAMPPPWPDSMEPSGGNSSIGQLVLTLGGAGLILTGLLLACTLPLQWLSLASSDSWTQQIIRAGLFIRAAGAVGLMILGLGALFQKRWAPPLIHATGWVGAFISSGIIAAAAWRWANGDAATNASSPLGGSDSALLLISLALPLAMVLIFQRPDLQEVCDVSDPKPRWTDELPVPGVMVFICGLILAVAGIGMMQHHAAFPLAGQSILRGPTAVAAWTSLTVLGLGLAYAAVRHSRWAWWTLLAASILVIIGPGISGILAPRFWSDFLTTLGKSTGSLPTSSFAALLTGLSPLPLLLVLAMARRAFSFSPPP